MRAGPLRHRVRIEAEQKLEDGMGGGELEWQPVVTVWARIEPLTVRETFTAGQTEAEVDHRVSIRFRKGVTAGMRVVPLADPTRRLAIVGPPRDIEGRHRELELLCKESRQKDGR